jgi:uncharacterized protein (TIGR02284 family)
MAQQVALTDDLVAYLQSLARLNIDSRDGFQYALDHLPENSSHLKQLFEKASKTRESAAAELNDFVAEYDLNEVVEKGSFVATLHRSIIAVRDSISSNQDPYAVLAEAERGEDAILHAYEAALQEDFGPEINAKVREQFIGVKAIHDQVRSLRDAAA